MSVVAITADAVGAEMRAKVSEIADLAPTRNRKAALQWTANVLRLPYSRVKCLFYGEARRIEAHEADRVRAYVTNAEKLIEARDRYEAIRREYLAATAESPRLARLAPGPLSGKAAALVKEAEALIVRERRK